MANDIGLISGFCMYRIESVDDNQFKSVISSSKIKELTQNDEESLGFISPIYSRPDQLVFPLGDAGYLVCFVRQFHGFHKGRLKSISDKIAKQKITEKKKELGDEEISQNMRNTIQKEARKEAKDQMKKDGLTNIDEREFPILIHKREKLAFIPVMEDHKQYEVIKSALSSAGVTGISQIVIQENALKNAMTALLQTNSLVSGVSAGQDYDGYAFGVSLGGAAKMRQQSQAGGDVPELVQARHFDLNMERSEMQMHIKSQEAAKMVESLEFVVKNSNEKIYYGTLNANSSYSSVGWDKPAGELDKIENEDDYIVDRAIRSADVMVAFKRIMESLEDLKA